MGSKARKPWKSRFGSGVDSAMRGKSMGDKCITVEVVSLKDMPLLQRRREANKPLYLTRYE